MPSTAKFVQILVIQAVGAAGVEAFCPPPPHTRYHWQFMISPTVEVVEVLAFDYATCRQACTYSAHSDSWDSWGRSFWPPPTNGTTDNSWYHQLSRSLRYLILTTQSSAKLVDMLNFQAVGVVKVEALWATHPMYLWRIKISLRVGIVRIPTIDTSEYVNWSVYIPCGQWLSMGLGISLCIRFWFWCEYNGEKFLHYVWGRKC